MKGVITHFDYKNAQIKIKNQYQDQVYDEFYLVGKFKELLDSDKKVGMEIDFLYDKDEKGNKRIKTFELIKPKIELVPATEVKEVKKDYYAEKLEFDRLKQEDIKKEALINSAIEIVKTLPANIDYKVQLERTKDIAKELYKFIETNW